VVGIRLASALCAAAAGRAAAADAPRAGAVQITALEALMQVRAAA
jgi:hypothetical protein